jgi:hypothetical protein
MNQKAIFFPHKFSYVIGNFSDFLYLGIFKKIKFGRSSDGERGLRKVESYI